MLHTVCVRAQHFRYTTFYYISFMFDIVRDASLAPSHSFASLRLTVSIVQMLNRALQCLCHAFVQYCSVCMCHWHNSIFWNSQHQLDVVNDNSDFLSSFWSFVFFLLWQICLRQFLPVDTASWHLLKSKTNKKQTEKTICIVDKLLQLNKSSTQNRRRRRKSAHKGNETKSSKQARDQTK